jgi:hypothetical protein
VAFEDVTFAYPGGKPVLHEVSFRAQPGSLTALVGPSGAGNSPPLHCSPEATLSDAALLLNGLACSGSFMPLSPFVVPPRLHPRRGSLPRYREAGGSTSSERRFKVLEIGSSDPSLLSVQALSAAKEQRRTNN